MQKLFLPRDHHGALSSTEYLRSPFLFARFNPVAKTMYLLVYAPLLLINLFPSPTTALQSCQANATSIILSHPTCEKDEYRQLYELQSLFKRLDRSQGKWEQRHPRYRLLDALYGFLSHQDLVSNEVTRWRTLYKSVYKAQKKVQSLPAPRVLKEIH